MMQSFIYPKYAARIDRSIKKNFEAGGRPKKWEPSLRNRTTGRKTLVKEAILQNSIRVIPTKTGIKAGTPVVYAAIHNFGGKINKTVTVRQHTRRNKSGSTSTVKSHNREMNLTMPKREFMLQQKSDKEYLKNLIIKTFSKEISE